MNYEKFQIGPLPVKVYRKRLTNGECLLQLNCAVPHCPRKCAISYRMESALWRVESEEHARKLSSLCGELAKLALETRKQNGLKSPI